LPASNAGNTASEGCLQQQQQLLLLLQLRVQPPLLED
jgi:hypothetical protein